jgi:RimJ/RimL family protein N-acetyltransferase
MKFEIIETIHLTLRKITPDVYDYAFKNLSDIDIMTFFGLKSEEDLLKEKEKFQKGIATYNRSFVNFLIIDKETDAIIGACGFHTWYFDHHRAEIGYALNDDSYKGKGIMTEALKAVVDYGFNTMNLNRIEALIGPKNEASLRLVRKLNFTKEGHLRQHYFKNNVMEDSLIYSLLLDEYQQSM